MHIGFFFLTIRKLGMNRNLLCYYAIYSNTLRGLNLADCGKIAKLSPGEIFATSYPRN